MPTATGGGSSDAKIDISHIRPTTRFSDLTEALQRDIEAIDALVLRQISCHNQCKAVLPKVADDFATLPDDVTYCAKQLESATAALEADARAVDRVRTTVKRDAAEARLSFAAVDSLKVLPQLPFHYLGGGGGGGGGSGSSGSSGGGPHVTNPPPPTATGVNGIDNNNINDNAGVDEGAPRDLVSFFAQRADAMAQSLQAYERNLAEVEAHLGIVEARTGEQLQQAAFSRAPDGSARSGEEQLRELAAVLRDFEHGIVGVAGKVANVRDAVQELTLGSTAGLNGGL
jgi:nucleoporin p58/p45